MTTTTKPDTASLTNGATVGHDLDADCESLATALWTSFESEPVEDGMEHLAETIIADAYRSEDRRHVLDWLKSFSTDASQPSFAASVLRCMGRIDNLGNVPWRVGVLRESLAIDNVEIRDAAVQAAELWADVEVVDVLRSHSEPEPWIRQYILDVADDLTS